MSGDHNPFSNGMVSTKAIFYSPLMQPIMEIASLEEFYEAKACEFTNQGLNSKSQPTYN